VQTGVKGDGAEYGGRSKRRSGMETKARKRLFNVIMVALIAVIAACGILAVGNVKGWFGGSGSSAVTTGEVSGIVNMERSGVAYSLKENVSVKAGDIVETKAGAEAALTVNGDNTLTMAENSEIKFTSCSSEDVKLTLNQGELFAEVPEAPDNLQVKFGKNTAEVTGTVFSVNAQTGSSSLSVYEGEVKVAAEDGSEQTVKAGQALSVAHSGDGSLDVQVIKLDAASLSSFLLEKAINCDSADKLCFAKADLEKLQKERNAESRQAALEAEEGDSIAASGSSETGSSKAGSSGSSKQQTAGKKIESCTIQIRCDTILNNMGNLTAGKEAYVPSNGVILATSTVEFTDGETVFDVLKRVCSYTGIQLEYSWTPMYGSYYIEGINNLYEFDCGNESGWMYKVNGWFPNYGCSSYTLKNGDTIVWCYTCNGLGADVGGSVY
jgi:hypothetical protein